MLVVICDLSSVHNSIYEGIIVLIIVSELAEILTKQKQVKHTATSAGTRTTAIDITTAITLSFSLTPTTTTTTISTC